MYGYTYIYLYMYTYIYLYMYTYRHIYVCVCVCGCVYVDTQTHTCIYKHGKCFAHRMQQLAHTWAQAMAWPEKRKKNSLALHMSQLSRTACMFVHRAQHTGFLIYVYTIHMFLQITKKISN